VVDTPAEVAKIIIAAHKERQRKIKKQG